MPSPTGGGGADRPSPGGDDRYPFVFLQRRSHPWSDQYRKYRAELPAISFILLKRKQKPPEVKCLSPGVRGIRSGSPAGLRSPLPL